MTLPVTINGNRHQFVVDTGSSVSVFDSSLRRELGRPLRTASAETTADAIQVQIFRAPPAKLGGRVMSGVSEVVCTDLSRARAASGMDFRGIIGMDFLRHRIVHVDFDHGEFLCLRAVPKDAGEPLALKWSPEGPILTLHLAGDGPVPFIIDTGCTAEGILDSKLFRRLIEHGLAVPVVTEPLESAQGSRDRRGALVHEVSLNSFRHRGLLFFEGSSNLLGLGFLSRYAVTIDFPSKRLYLKRGARFNEPSRWNLSGLYATRLNEVTSIETVTAGSPAENAGLKAGDVLEQIDSRSTGSITLAEVERALRREGKHTLRVSRGGETREIVLDLKEPPGIRAALEAGRTVVVPEARGEKRDRN